MSDKPTVRGAALGQHAVSFEGLLEAVPDALVGVDQAGVIRFVNHQTESLFGYDRTDMVGQPIQTLVPEYLWEVYSEHREEYFADPRSRSMGLDLELGGRQQDGSELPVNISLSHLDTGDVLLVITAVREVNGHAQALENSRLFGGDRREFERRHHRQDARRHDHELEPGRREDVRLLQRRDARHVHRPAQP